jgi:TolA-binding protein
MDIATLTTLGGVVTSVASSAAAALAWSTKLQFSEEFKEARNAQVIAATQIVDSMKAQKEAEVQQVKVEIQRKDVEIERLKAKIEDLERDTSKALQAKFDELKAAYESMIGGFQILSSNSKQITENQELNSKKELFETQLAALGEEIDWMVRLSQDRINYRKEARKWLQSNYKNLAENAFDYVFTRHPSLFRVCEDSEKDHKLKQFYWDIEEYLETISDCLVVDRHSLIDRQNPTLPIPDAYRIAFNHIKKQITGDISDAAASEIRKYLDYLLASFG